MCFTNTEQKEDDINEPDDDDDDEFGMDGASMPFPKDILARLRANKLKYQKVEMQPAGHDKFGNFGKEQPVSQKAPDFEYINKKLENRLLDIFKKFLSNNEMEEVDNKNRNWLFEKRLMMMVDRRGHTPPDTLWFVPHDDHDML